VRPRRRPERPGVLTRAQLAAQRRARSGARPASVRRRDGQRTCGWPVPESDSPLDSLRPPSNEASSGATGTISACFGRRRERTVSVIQICCTPAWRSCRQQDTSVPPVSRMSSTTTTRWPGEPTMPRCSTPVGVLRLRAHTIGRSTPAARATAEHRSMALSSGATNVTSSRQEFGSAAASKPAGDRDVSASPSTSAASALWTSTQTTESTPLAAQQPSDPGEPHALRGTSMVLTGVCRVEQRGDILGAGAAQRVGDQRHALEVAHRRGDRPDEDAAATIHTRWHLGVKLAIGEPPNGHTLNHAADAGSEPLIPGQHQRDRSRNRTLPLRAAKTGPGRKRSRVIANPDRHCGARRYAGTGIGSSIASPRWCMRSATVGMVVNSMSFIGNRPGSNGRVRGDAVSHFERLPPRAVKRTRRRACRAGPRAARRRPGSSSLPPAAVRRTRGLGSRLAHTASAGHRAGR
jgi:hypothetical protein